MGYQRRVHGGFLFIFCANVTMAEEKTMSFANIHGEDWEVKEISVYGAAKAFIRQLSVGMDLTHVSIPAIFLLPYSILEFVAVRMTHAFHLLLDMPKEKDPRKRLEGVLKYGLGSTKAEDLTLNHKPSNSVLGEIHKARCDHPDGSHSYVLCEQVLHHPPTSAFEICNPTHGVRVAGNMLFGVLFHSNSVTVEVKGGVKVYFTLPDGTEEVYLLEEGIPDMYIKNVLLGTKYVYWTGQLTCKCPSTGYMAQMVYGFKDNKNTVNGIIWNANDKSDKKEQVKVEKSPGWASRWARATVNAAKSTAKFTTGWIYDYEGEDAWLNNLKLPFDPEVVQARFGGIVGAEINVYPGGLRRKDEPINPDPEKYLLVDARHVHSEECSVYPSPDNLEPNSSIAIWREVGEALVKGDMEKADTAKTEVEEKQREIRKQRETEFVPRYFSIGSEDGWEFWSVKDTKWYENDSCNLFVKQ